MEQNPFAPKFEDLPMSLPVFPLSSALLLPLGQLPLNIFEPRYLQMVEDAMATDRLIGMIQPHPADQDARKPRLQQTGCAGKIIEFSETEDGRYLISLSGVYRFNIDEELSTTKTYRIVKPDWTPYKSDFSSYKSLDLDREKLKSLMKSYFEQHDMNCDWYAFDRAADGKLITCLSMLCPFDPAEKQSLLEASCAKKRAALFIGMLEMALKSGFKPCSDQCH